MIHILLTTLILNQNPFIRSTPQVPKYFLSLAGGNAISVQNISQDLDKIYIAKLVSLLRNN